MPKNISEKYKNDEKFREKMKENSRKRYAEMKEALLFKKQKILEEESLLKNSPLQQ
jgi:hypothetical protein